MIVEMSRPASLGLTFQSTAVFLTKKLSVSESTLSQITFCSGDNAVVGVVVPLLTSIDFHE